MHFLLFLHFIEFLSWKNEETFLREFDRNTINWILKFELTMEKNIGRKK